MNKAGRSKTVGDLLNRASTRDQPISSEDIGMVSINEQDTSSVYLSREYRDVFSDQLASDSSPNEPPERASEDYIRFSCVEEDFALPGSRNNSN